MIKGCNGVGSGVRRDYRLSWPGQKSIHAGVCRCFLFVVYFFVIFMFSAFFCVFLDFLSVPPLSGYVSSLGERIYATSGMHHWSAGNLSVSTYLGLFFLTMTKSQWQFLFLPSLFIFCSAALYCWDPGGGGVPVIHAGGIIQDFRSLTPPPCHTQEGPTPQNYLSFHSPRSSKPVIWQAHSLHRIRVRFGLGMQLELGTSMLVLILGFCGASFWPGEGFNLSLIRHDALCCAVIFSL